MTTTTVAVLASAIGAAMLAGVWILMVNTIRNELLQNRHIEACGHSYIQEPDEPDTPPPPDIKVDVRAVDHEDLRMAFQWRVYRDGDLRMVGNSYSEISAFYHASSWTMSDLRLGL